MLLLYVPEYTFIKYEVCQYFNYLKANEYTIAIDPACNGFTVLSPNRVPKISHAVTGPAGGGRSGKSCFPFPGAEIGCEVIAPGIMPNQIHLSVSAIPSLSPAVLAGKIKGGAGSTVAAQFPELKKKGHMWSRPYFPRHDRQYANRSDQALYRDSSGAG